MTSEQAIQYIDEQVAYLTKRGLVPPFVNKKLVECLECLVEATMGKQPDAEAEATENNMLGIIRKLRTIIRCTGITEKALDAALNYNENFLENWLSTCQRTGLYIQTEKAWMLMESAHRSCMMLSENDVDTLNAYRFLRDNKISQAAIRIREMYPHLESYFATIDQGAPVNEQKARTQLFEYHCKN